MTSNLEFKQDFNMIFGVELLPIMLRNLRDKFDAIWIRNDEVIHDVFMIVVLCAGLTMICGLFAIVRSHEIN